MKHPHLMPPVDQPRRILPGTRLVYVCTASHPFRQEYKGVWYHPNATTKHTIKSAGGRESALCTCPDCGRVFLKGNEE